MAGDTNYTLYYNVLDYFKTIMNNHPSINFVSQGDVFSVDTKEFPQYPLGNVLITNATFDGKSTDYAVQLIVADKTKLKGNESSGSFNEQTNTFEGVDDTVDVHANTLSILNDLLSWTERKEEGFEITSTIGCTAFKERFDNGLAGWTADFTLRVHNDRNICLFDLSLENLQSGYILKNCQTSEIKYALVNELLTVGDFISTNINDTATCFEVTGSVTRNEWDYTSLSVVNYYDDCADCIANIPEEVPTDGLIHFFDAENPLYNGPKWLDLVGNKTGSMLATTYVSAGTASFYDVDVVSSIEPDFGTPSFSGSMERTILFYVRTNFDSDGAESNRDIISFYGNRTSGNGKSVRLQAISGSAIANFDVSFQGGGNLYDLGIDTPKDEWYLVGYTISGSAEQSDVQLVYNGLLYDRTGTEGVDVTIDTLPTYEKIGNWEPLVGVEMSGSIAAYIQYNRILNESELRTINRIYSNRYL